MKSAFTPLLAAVALSAACSSATPEAAPPPAKAATAPLPAGIDEKGIDTSVAPGDDFYAYANGSWMKATPIPGDKPAVGASTLLVDKTREQTIAIIQDPANSGASASPEARKVGDFYAAFMDEKTIEAKGLTPLKPALDAIAAIADRTALARAIGGTLRADT